jgi:hypothetical protein
MCVSQLSCGRTISQGTVWGVVVVSTPVALSLVTNSKGVVVECVVSPGKFCLTCRSVPEQRLRFLQVYSHDAHTWENDNAYLSTLALALLSYYAPAYSDYCISMTDLIQSS